MKSAEFLTEAKANWVIPPPKVMRADYDEYKLKEKSKWKGRAATIGARFPIFKNFDDFAHSITNGKIVNSSDHTTESLEGLKERVKTYIYPRDVDRIVKGFTAGVPMPLPIILQGVDGTWRMSGNTRSNVAWLMKLPVKAILVDVRK